MGERRGTKALELWCKRMVESYPGVKIENMTTSWRDGLAFCALVHHFRPDIIEFDKLNKNDVYHNNELAFRMAEIHLGIPALLDAEDMESSYVPDRLSILTYLSQFYQTFASQEQTNRLKRTTSSAEQLPKTTGPPPKMAHIVGVPKREPCQKCSLPVFLAERLKVGSKTYHRTCLRCARCNSQLTPGSFYETEVDNEFCCETCPDEEVEGSNNVPSEHETSDNNNRSSIADRLAFFERGNDGATTTTKLLQKSLSDEEKSRSLKKISELKQNPALTNFMSKTLGENVENNGSIENHESQKENNSDDDFTEPTTSSDDSNSGPPQLPETLPPEISENEVSIPNRLTISENTVEKNSSILIDSSETDNTELLPESENEDSVKKKLKSTDSDLECQLLDATNETTNSQPILDDKKLNEQLLSEQNKGPTGNIENNFVMERKSLVHARLHQFEVIAANKNRDSIKFNNDLMASNSSNVSNNEKNLNAKISDNIDNKTIGYTESDEYKVPNYHTDDNKKDIPNSFNHKNLENESYIEENSQINNNFSEQHEIKYTENYQKDEEETKKPTDIENKNDYDLIKDDNSVEVKNEQQSINNIKLDKEIILPNNDEPKDTLKLEEYPEELNPFQSDDEDNIDKTNSRSKSLNPFGSSDDENGEMCTEKENKKLKPPRPPPPRKFSKNPFGSDTDDETSENIKTTENQQDSSVSKKVPVPTPRTQLATSKQSTPEPTPRPSARILLLEQSSEFHGSSASLNASFGGQRELFSRHHDTRSSNNSLSSGGSNTILRRKNKKAPAPPPPKSASTSREILTESKDQTPNSSKPSTPQSIRKKRPAPKPPAFKDKIVENISLNQQSNEMIPNIEIEKLSDEEKAAHFLEEESLENKIQLNDSSKQRLIALDVSLIEDESLTNESLSDDITYRRKIHVPLDLSTPEKDIPSDSPFNIIASDEVDMGHDRQSEKLKDNKEAKNRNRQSQISNDDVSSTNSDPLLLNKQIHGKWKRRKGPAPMLPIPPRKVLQMLPLQEIRHELEIIEVQQQGLEKQGVVLEKMIRERCEGQNGELIKNHGNMNPKEVEDLILQLFELVNEKNELFRKQAELMYLRRQHRLEQEQADLEYEIRVLMAQPERNKTDSDKSREEGLISRLVEVVQLRNEVIECLEMDRLREAEEDMSIKQRLELHTAQREQQQSCSKTLTKLSKKEKKKLKESKKLEKSKKLDADKDADESELSIDSQKLNNKKKKKFLFGHL